MGNQAPGNSAGGGRCPRAEVTSEEPPCTTYPPSSISSARCSCAAREAGPEPDGFPRGSSVLVTGRPGVGKAFFTLALIRELMRPEDRANHLLYYVGIGTNSRRLSERFGVRVVPDARPRLLPQRPGPHRRHPGGGPAPALPRGRGADQPDDGEDPLAEDAAPRGHERLRGGRQPHRPGQGQPRPGRPPPEHPRGDRPARRDPRRSPGA